MRTPSCEDFFGGMELRVQASDWHQKELQKTEKDFASGHVEILEWEAAKKELRKRFLGNGGSRPLRRG